MEKKELKPYLRTAQYYETDAMRIVHHSNYIRWMEEARTDFLEQIGFPYREIEERGILFPVLSVSCQYKQAVCFGDEVRIEIELAWFDGLRYGVTYRITSTDGKILHATGETTHGFVSSSLRPLRVKNTHPDIFEAFCTYAAEKRGVLKRHENTEAARPSAEG